MIILDTNVLSELLRPQPHVGVVAWVAAQPRASLFSTTVTRAEIFYGVEILPPGARKQALWAAAKGLFDEDLAGQVLSFDADAADAFAEIAGLRKSSGHPISQFDAMIAAMALSRGASLATRNIKDFVGCGVALVDPWSV